MKELVTVKITRAAHDFLKEFARHLKEQNNRSTAAPYYYVVKAAQPMFVADGHGDKEVLVDEEDEGRVFPTSDRTVVEDTLLSEGYLSYDATDIADRCKRLSTKDIPEKHNVFFTEKGYEEHMALNKHNYPDNAHSFVEHAFRNPEIKALLEIAKAIGGQDV